MNKASVVCLNTYPVVLSVVLLDLWFRCLGQEPSCTTTDGLVDPTWPEPGLVIPPRPGLPQALLAGVQVPQEPVLLRHPALLVRPRLKLELKEIPCALVK